jgi:DNA-binding SARP family transcriptional activator
MEFRILGPMEVLDGQRHLDLPAGRARVLLALFILRAGEAVAVDRVIDDLWGEYPPPTVHTIVQGFVSRLRKILEPGRDPREQPAILQTAGQGYRLAIDPEAVDAHRFTRLLEEARDVDHEARSSLLRGALALWRGPALADFTYEPFAQQPIAALESSGSSRSRSALTPTWHSDCMVNWSRSSSDCSLPIPSGSGYAVS